MNASWRKSLRDLGADPWRSSGIVAALSLGLVGLVAVLSSYAILVRALNDGYRQSSPPSATIEIERTGETAIRSAVDVPDLEVAEPRRTIRGRIKVGPAQWRNLVIFVRPDLEGSQIAKLSLQDGAWPNGAGEIAIERDALQVARARVGDVVSIRTENGSEHELRITGSVHDVGQAQARMENLVYGYIEGDAVRALGEPPGYDEVALRVASYPDDEAHVLGVAERVASMIGTQGTRTSGVEVHPHDEHPHAKIMGLLLASIAVFGLFILALSGVLVFNLITAVLAGQVRQIGVMKALGARRWHIARIYLFEASLLGMAAVAVAVAFGLIGARWLSRTLAVFLNFDIASFAVPPWVFASVFAAGVLVPLAAALLPVWRGTRVPVREALAAEAARARTFGASAIDRMLARASGRNRVVLLAVRNAARNRLRTALTIATLATAGIFFMSALDVRSSLVATVDRFYAASRSDLSVTLAEDHSVEALERAAQEVPGVERAEAWLSTEAVLDPSNPSRQRNTLAILGLPSASKMVAFDLVTGSGDLEGAVVVNTVFWDHLGRPPVGTTVTLPIDAHGIALPLGGVAREPFTPPAAYVGRDAMVNRGGALTANAMRIDLVDPGAEAVDAAKAALEASLEGAGIRIVQTTTKIESRYSFDQHMVMIYVFLIIVSVILGGVGTLGVSTTASLNVMERRRELGILRALGATPRRIALLVVIESVAIGVAAWLVAAAAVLPLTKVIGDAILRLVLSTGAEITTAIDPTGLVVWLAVSILGSALASLVPARQAARVTVREALTHE